MENDEVVAFLLAEYEATGNALFLADAFVHSVKHGEGQPPALLLRWLADALDSWSTSNGKADLAVLLKLKGRPGSTTVFEKFDISLRDAVLLQDMDTLLHLDPKASQEQAAAIASDRLPNDGGPWRGVLSVETLAKKYAGRKESVSSDYLAGITSTPESVSRFLRQFGSTYLTQRLKSML